MSGEHTHIFWPVVNDSRHMKCGVCGLVLSSEFEADDA